ncbi:MAG: malate dehydrogenase [Chlamydiae bacterium]|nr:malate dehydrogenase [Chlamydiota bacterium]
MKIAITGAAGQISYALIPLLLERFKFPIELSLIDLPDKISLLRGLEMELEDFCFSNLKNVSSGSDENTLFEGVDVAIFLGAKPRAHGMERSDLITVNGATFHRQGKILADVANPKVKALVVGNPANTNALMLIRGGDYKLKNQVQALMRLDQNRAETALKLAGRPHQDVFVFGNHSPTIFVHNASMEINDFVRKRGADVIKARGMSSQASAAKAVVDHLDDWMSSEDRQYSAAIYSKNNPYGVDEDLVFSFPFSNKKGILELPLSREEQGMLKQTEDEMQKERQIACTIPFLN